MGSRGDEGTQQEVPHGDDPWQGDSGWVADCASFSIWSRSFSGVEIKRRHSFFILTVNSLRALITAKAL